MNEILSKFERWSILRPHHEEDQKCPRQLSIVDICRCVIASRPWRREMPAESLRFSLVFSSATGFDGHDVTIQRRQALQTIKILRRRHTVYRVDSHRYCWLNVETKSTVLAFYDLFCVHMPSFARLASVSRGETPKVSRCPIEEVLANWGTGVVASQRKNSISSTVSSIVAGPSNTRFLLLLCKISSVSLGVEIELFRRYSLCPNFPHLCESESKILETQRTFSTLPPSLPSRYGASITSSTASSSDCSLMRLQAGDPFSSKNFSSFINFNVDWPIDLSFQ